MQSALRSIAGADVVQVADSDPRLDRSQAQTGRNRGLASPVRMGGPNPRASHPPLSPIIAMTQTSDPSLQGLLDGRRK
jgi:hypothetical protein